MVGIYFDETRLLKHFLIQCISGADTEHSPGHRSHLSMMENSISLPLVSRPRHRPRLSRAPPGVWACRGGRAAPGGPGWAGRGRLITRRRDCFLFEAACLHCVHWPGCSHSSHLSLISRAIHHRPAIKHGQTWTGGHTH